MFLFGGNNYKQTIKHEGDEKNYNPMYSLNLRTFTWSIQKARGEVVKPRDEHTACVDEENSLMIIFGGFCEGERTNEIVIYNMKTNMWQAVKLPANARKPSARSGHGAAYFNGTLYVFGGKDQDSNKLNDLWAFNLEGKYWDKVVPEEGLAPCIRSGLTACIYEGCFVIFGGILEVTKELNDIWAFSFQQNRWILVQDDPSLSPRT